VTIGQVTSAPANECGGQFDLIQPTVTSGNSYVIPSTGGIAAWTVTSWSTSTTASPGQSMAVKIFRKIGDPITYQVVGHEGPHPLAAGLNTFPAHIAVKPGDVLGAYWTDLPMNLGGACDFQATGDSILYFGNTGLPDGGSASFLTDANFRLNASAELTPTSEFSLGKVKANPNGTATLPVNVPNPGQLNAKGNGVRASSTGAVSAKKVSGPGKVKLVIRAAGKSAQKLADTGKLTLKTKIVFTPTGGAANTQMRKIKLRRK
jgi:hypothetical protein